MHLTFLDRTQCLPVEDGFWLKHPLCTPLLMLFCFSFGHVSLSLSLPSSLSSLSCPSPWCCCSLCQGAKEGVAAQGLHRPGLQHRWWGGWRRHLRLLHPGRRASWPERRAEEGRPDSLGQYLNLKLSVYPHQVLKQVWGTFQRFPGSSCCQTHDDRIKVV